MFSTWPFWVLVVLATVAYRLLPDAAVRARAAVLAGLGLAGAWTVLGLAAPLFMALIAATAWMALAVRHLGGQSAAGRPALAAALVVAPVLVAWMLGKHLPAAASTAPHFFFFAGTSYFLVKAWTLAKDRADGRIRDYEPLTAAAYFLHLPTYLSGPMHYYAEFESGLRRTYSLSAVSVADIVLRLLWGLAKVKVLSPLIQPVSLLALKDVADPSLAQLALGAVAFSAVLYLDFSGYSDMAIAVSRAVGMDAPENFRLPYLARNIREFWQRWHISFTRALTAYIFVPLSRAAQKRWPDRPRLVMMTGYMVTFGLAGYWHGPTANFVAWGLYHAVGLIAYDLFRNWRLRCRVGRGPQVATNALLARAQHGAAMVATFLFISLGWILFVLPLGVLFR
jgi:alginate O-acetyltransferase complex protein AlgI